MLREERLAVGGLSLNVARGPAAGPPLMLMHGVTRRWQSYVPVIPAWLPRWSVMAWNARGHGNSDRGSAYRVVDYVADAVALVRSRFSEPGVLYGHSMGAMVALATAAQVPELVRGVILEDPPFETMGPGIRQSVLYSFFAGLKPLAGSSSPIFELAREIGEVELFDPVSEARTKLKIIRDATALLFTAKSLQQLDPHVFDSILAADWLTDYDDRNWPRQVQAPTLILQSDPQAGAMLTDATAERLLREMPQATLVRFPGAPHLIHWAQPEILLRHVLGFLESL